MHSFVCLPACLPDPIQSNSSIYQCTHPPTDGRGREATALSNLGHITHRRSNKDPAEMARAEVLFERAVRADPTFVDAQYNYGVLLDELGRYAA